MHTYVYSGTVYSSKDLEPTQMPIDDRLDKENVAHIHHGILAAIKKEGDRLLFRNVNGARSHYPQQTNAGTVNQIPHVLTHNWELNDENTWIHWGKRQTLRPVEGEGAGGGRGVRSMLGLIPR